MAVAVEVFPNTMPPEYNKPRRRRIADIVAKLICNQAS
jgi:hypothetical protein